MNLSFLKRWLRPKYGIGAIVVLGLSFLVLPFLPVPNPPIHGWGAFLGRFHPLVVHFPIVLVIIPLLLEGAARIWRQDAFLKLVPLFWGLAALSCIAAVVAGYLLYISGEYGGELIRLHLWAGIVLVILVLASAVLSLFRERQREYITTAIVANMVVVYAGHLGGSLTHGEDFLVDAFPGWGFVAAAVESRPREELRVLQDLVMPGFETRCMSCHNPQKAKGKLDMTSFAALSRGGDSGKPMFVPGFPDSSEVYRRLLLPPGDDDRMPPDGKPSLSSDEIAILQWWIEAGADPEMKLGEGPPDMLRRTVIERYLPRLIQIQRRRIRQRNETAALHRDLQKVADRLALVVEIDPDTDSTLFAFSMRFPPERVDDETLSSLASNGEAVSKLSLISSDITDDGLRHLAGMRNLRELILQKTAITGMGLAHLQSLPALEVLNLSHSALTDSGAVHLLKMPALKQVYVYNTAVSDSILDAVRMHLPDTQILNIEGEAY